MVKVIAWCQIKGLVTRIMHAKYQYSIINTSEDMTQVKVFVMDRRTDKWVLMSPAFAKGGGQKVKFYCLMMNEKSTNLHVK